MLQTQGTMQGTQGLKLYSEREAAQALSMCPGTLNNWRQAGRGPRFIRLGNGPRARIRYREADLLEWIAEQPAMYETGATVGR